MSTKRALVSILFCTGIFTAALPSGLAQGEPMTCLGACRVDYGTCLIAAKTDAPLAAEVHRADCGRAYVRCSTQCKGAHTERGRRMPNEGS
jgi:hypothetical protein